MRLLSFLLLPLILTTANAFPQVSGSYKYSIAARGVSIFQNPKIFNQNTEKYMTGKVTGGMIKFNDNSFSYRVSGNLLEKSVSAARDCMNCELAEGRVKDYAFKLGFEKNLNYTLLQPYFAVDLGYRYNRFGGTMSSLNMPGIPATSYTAEDLKNGGTATASIGLKINICEQVSLFIENGLEFYYAYIRQEKTAMDASASKSSARFTRGEFLLNPLSAGIQIQLGNKN